MSGQLRPPPPRKAWAYYGAAGPTTGCLQRLLGVGAPRSPYPGCRGRRCRAVTPLGPSARRGSSPRPAAAPRAQPPARPARRPSCVRPPHSAPYSRDLALSPPLILLLGGSDHVLCVRRVPAASAPRTSRAGGRRPTSCSSSPACAGSRPASASAMRPPQVASARVTLGRRASRLGDRERRCDPFSTARAARPWHYLLGTSGGRLSGGSQLCERLGSGRGGVASGAAGANRRVRHRAVGRARRGRAGAGRAAAAAPQALAQHAHSLRTPRAHRRALLWAPPARPRRAARAARTCPFRGGVHCERGAAAGAPWAAATGLGGLEASASDCRQRHRTVRCVSRRE